MSFFNQVDLVCRQEYSHEYRLAVTEDGILFSSDDGQVMLIPFFDKWSQLADFKITQHVEFVNGNYNRIGLTFHQENTDPEYDD